MNSNALDVILMSILDMIGIETQETRDIKSGKKAIENTKGNRLSPKDQKFKAGGQTEMFNNRGKLRDFRSPAQSATRQPTTSPIRHTPTQTLNPGPVRPPAPGQGTLGGEVPRNMRLRAPAIPPRMGKPTAAGPQSRPPIRGESYDDLKAKPKPKSPGVKNSSPKPNKPTPKPTAPKPGRFSRIRGGLKGTAAAMAVPLLIEALRRAPGPTGRKFNELMNGVSLMEDMIGPGIGSLGPLLYPAESIKAMQGVLELLGLVDEGYFDQAPEAPELPDSEGLTMPEIETQPMNPQEGSEAQRESYWNQAPITPVVPPRNLSQAPVRATREQLRPQIDPTMPNMGYETVSPNRGQLAPNPFYGR